MSLTIVVSGAKSSEPQVRTALASQGFTVQKTVHDHGFPPDPDGNPEAFVTVVAEEEQLDAVAACAASLSYRLRLHHETPEPSPPSAQEQLAATLADMRREIDELRAKVG
jgi:vacuolar-type H+-ATPase subunit I/STV1